MTEVFTCSQLYHWWGNIASVWFIGNLAAKIWYPNNAGLLKNLNIQGVVSSIIMPLSYFSKNSAILFSLSLIYSAPLLSCCRENKSMTYKIRCVVTFRWKIIKCTDDLCAVLFVPRMDSTRIGLVCNLQIWLSIQTLPLPAVGEGHREIVTTSWRSS